MKNKLELELKLNYLRDLWQEFCEKHSLLYEITCDEYMHLMASDMDSLEVTVKQKEDLVQNINELDTTRQSLIEEIAELLEIEKPENMNSLLSSDKITETIKDQITKYNEVLLDMVNKIMEQNKKNQFFLNKAIHSLNELKESFSGKANYSTYSADGVKRNNNTY